MKRGLAIGGGILVVLLLLVGGGAYLLLSNLGSIIVTAVEQYGSDVTQTEVSLANAEVDITTGEGALSGLKVGNPQGFNTDSAFSLGEIAVKLDTTSVTGPMLVITEVKVEKPEVTYEIGDGGSNIDAIRENVNAFVAAQGGGGTSGGESSAEGGSDSGKKLVIDDLYIEGGMVNVSASFLQGEKMSAELPRIHLTNIGRDSGGATPEQVVEAIVASLDEATGKAIAGMDLGALQQGVEGAAGAIQEGAEGALEDATGAVEGSGDTLEQGVKDAEGTIKNLLDN